MKMKKICALLLCLSLLLMTAAFAACDTDEHPKDDPPPEVTLSKIAITKEPAKTDYYVGDTFDPQGMVVTATYSDGTTKTVTDYTYAPIDKLILNDKQITVTYQTKTATQAITVTEKPAPVTLSKIEITKKPAKTTYYVGDVFDPQGIVVTATYSDGSTAAVTDYTYEPQGALSLGDDKITVTYKTKTTTQAITVGEKPAESAELSKIEITSAPDKTDYFVGETFDPTGMVVTATYADGSDAAVTDYAYAPNGELTVNDNEITVTYKTQTAMQAITVQDPPPPIPVKQIFEAEAADLGVVNNKWNIRWGAYHKVAAPSGTGYLTDWKGDGKGNKITFNITSDADAAAVLSVNMARTKKYDIWIGREEGKGNKMFSTLTLRGEHVALPFEYFPKSPDAEDNSEWMEKEIATVGLTKGENILEFTVDTDQMYWDWLAVTTTAKVEWTKEKTAGHHYCDWKVTSMPTDEFAGTMYRYCDTCCRTEEVALPALSTEGAYTIRKVRDATEYLSGLTEYTYRAEDCDHTFTTVSEPAAATAIDNKVEAESADISGDWDNGKIVRKTAATVDENKIEMLELNNRKGRLTYSVEASHSATVTLILRAAPHNSQDAKINDCLRLTVNDKLVCMDDLTLTQSAADSWYEFGDYTVATFDVNAGENSIVFDALGNFSYNFDYFVLHSAATVTPLP